MTEDLLAVGRIAKPHGVRGEVSVEPLSEVSGRFDPGSVLRLEDEGGTLTVESARPHGGRLLVTFREVPDRTAAEGLRGRLLLASASEAPPLEEGRYWIHEVVGLAVETEDGRVLGTVREVLQNEANDVWIVEGPGGEILLPALTEVVRDVDVQGRRAVVRPLPGLLDRQGEA